MGCANDCERGCCDASSSQAAARAVRRPLPLAPEPRRVSWRSRELPGRQIPPCACRHTTAPAQSVLTGRGVSAVRFRGALLGEGEQQLRHSSK